MSSVLSRKWQRLNKDEHSAVENRTTNTHLLLSARVLSKLSNFLFLDIRKKKLGEYSSFLSFSSAFYLSWFELSPYIVKTTLCICKCGKIPATLIICSKEKMFRFIFCWSFLFIEKFCPILKKNPFSTSCLFDHNCHKEKWSGTVRCEWNLRESNMTKFPMLCESEMSPNGNVCVCCSCWEPVGGNQHNTRQWARQTAASLPQGTSTTFSQQFTPWP